MKTVYRSTDWLNHVQFSPTDPGLIMFCHEGPWHKVDRIWTIRTDGTGLTKRHTRQMDMEIAGHEFFSADGKTIWYDLQTPKSEVFWLAGVDICAPGERTKYAVARADWSVHFNVSPDGRLFAGDGGGPHSVAAPGNGQWIYLFTPGQAGLVATPLVDLSAHDYSLEPNVTFTPDGRWIVFRSNMHGSSHVYAVELANAAASYAGQGQSVTATPRAVPVLRQSRSPDLAAVSAQRPVSAPRADVATADAPFRTDAVAKAPWVSRSRRRHLQESRPLRRLLRSGRHPRRPRLLHDGVELQRRAGPADPPIARPGELAPDRPRAAAAVARGALLPRRSTARGRGRRRSGFTTAGSGSTTPSPTSASSS